MRPCLLVFGLALFVSGSAALAEWNGYKPSDGHTSLEAAIERSTVKLTQVGVISDTAFGASQCTGVVFGADRILTARHCVDPNYDRGRPRTLVSPNAPLLVEWNGKSIAAKRFRVPVRVNLPGAGERIGFNTGDLAEVELPPDSIPQSARPNFIFDLPAAMPTEENGWNYGPQAEGQPLYSAGFGIIDLNEDTNDGLRISVLTIRTQSIEGIGAINSNHQATCEGDSGGPAFVKHHWEPYVVGITSEKIGTSVDGEPSAYCGDSTNFSPAWAYPLLQFSDWVSFLRH